MAVNHQFEYGTETYSGTSEVVFDPTWHASLSVDAGHAKIKVIRRGSLVTIAGLLIVNSAGITGGTVLTNLPVGLRPNNTFALTGKTNSASVGNVDVVIDVFANGDVAPNTDPLKDYVFINQSYWVA